MFVLLCIPVFGCLKIHTYISYKKYIYKAKMSVCLSTHQLSMVDLREKPMVYLETSSDEHVVATTNLNRKQV